MTSSQNISALLERLTEALAKQSIKVIDLSQTMTHGFPTIVLPPEFDQPAPFRTRPHLYLR